MKFALCGAKIISKRRSCNTGLSDERLADLASRAPTLQLFPMDRATTIALAEALARGIELTGIGVMVVGGLAAFAAFLVRLAARRAQPGGSFEPTYRDFRADLGRAILLGLEFLVAADIIGTVAVAPTFTNLGVLGLIVAIRTFLSFSLELEISGRWPWQHASAQVSEGTSGPSSGP